MNKLRICGVAVWIPLVAFAAEAHTKVSYSRFLQQARDGEISSVSIAPSESRTLASCRLKNGSTESAILPADYSDALSAMEQGHVDVEISETPISSRAINAIPFVVLFAVWLVMLQFKIGRSILTL